jgi:hypothetical protein
VLLAPSLAIINSRISIVELLLDGAAPPSHSTPEGITFPSTVTADPYVATVFAIK